MSFQGKKALVTGGSRGIGRGIAIKLAEGGAQVAVHYYRNEEAAHATLERIRSVGSNGFLVQADVCRPDEVRCIFKQVRSEFGSLDIFVNNARPEAATFYQAPMDIPSASRRADGSEVGNRGSPWVRRRQQWRF